MSLILFPLNSFYSLGPCCYFVFSVQSGPFNLKRHVHAHKINNVGSFLNDSLCLKLHLMPWLVMQPLYQQPQQAALNLTFFLIFTFCTRCIGPSLLFITLCSDLFLDVLICTFILTLIILPCGNPCTVWSYSFSARPHCLCGFWFVWPNSDFQGNHCHTLVTDFHSNSVCIALAKSIRCIKHQLLIIDVHILSDIDACFRGTRLTASSSVLFVRNPRWIKLFVLVVLVNCRKALEAGLRARLLQQAVWEKKKGSCYFSAPLTEA